MAYCGPTRPPSLLGSRELAPALPLTGIAAIALNEICLKTVSQPGRLHVRGSSKNKYPPAFCPARNSLYI